MRLIDADKIDFSTTFIGNSKLAKACRDGAQSLIDIQPTVDAVEVERCGNCVKRDICRTTNIWAVPPNDDWFCADGKRREVSK